MRHSFFIAGVFTIAAVSFLPSLVIGFSQQPDFVIHSDVRLVLLDVNVKDRHGIPVSGLAKGDFEVRENGKLQPITVFAHEDLPVTVGLLVDESFSMRPKRTQVLAAAETFIRESNPRDELFVLNFNDTVTRGLPDGSLFSGDIALLRTALARGVPRGMTALYDAVVEGSEQLEHGRRDKKVLVLISDGRDTASRHTRSQMLDRVQRSAATIYTIGLFEPEDPESDPHVLRDLARITGGDAYFPQKTEETESICRRVAQDIRTRYTIGYIPPSDGGGDSPRQIRVHVTSRGRGKLTAQTRTTYRYDQLKTQSQK